MDCLVTAALDTGDTGLDFTAGELLIGADDGLGDDLGDGLDDEAFFVPPDGVWLENPFIILPT